MLPLILVFKVFFLLPQFITSGQQQMIKDDSNIEGKDNDNFMRPCMYTNM